MDFQKTPALLFVLATVLPLASFLLIFLASGLWCLARRYRNAPGMEALYQFSGGDRPGPLPAYVALGAIALAFVCSLTGFVQYMTEQNRYLLKPSKALHEEVHDLEKEHKAAKGEEKKKLHEQIEEKEKELAEIEQAWEKRRAEGWKGKLFDLVRIRPFTMRDPERGTALEIGYNIDSLAALMFTMVTFVASLIHLFSIGYMKEEREEFVEDHHVHAGDHHHAVGTTHDDPVHHDTEHFKRRGRFGRFFMYLSLFCFSMLNLVLANNLFQVFISWELVGICSFLLIGFYFERQSASNAANKAFITNRIGDAGFILGLLIVFGYLGTFNFEEIFSRVRSPLKDSHGHLALGGKVVRANPVPLKEGETPTPGRRWMKVTLPGEEQGSEVVLFPHKLGHFHGLGPREQHEGEEGHETGTEFLAHDNPPPQRYTTMPYWMLVAAGLGIFLGCVGKSAQFPLQVWLPDAMEGPTPVSALIHAATMVAAGVYLVGRCYPLFTAEVLLTIAYVGGITLFVAATIAIVATDIKKVLAYSTVSQLGYMMLALGVGGWSAGLFHLFTHAFFKALLFLGSGSVIYGCHHEQEMTKMGGLFPKMKVTALTMLVGVLAIAGTPLFSGWHSKDAVVAQALGFVSVHPHHALLFILPLATAGITTFYMFRMWFMTFTGTPRDHHVYDHAHESPWMMTLPLVVLAVLAFCVSWGNRPWVATESYLESAIHHSQPVSVMAEFGHVEDHHEHFDEIAAKDKARNERDRAHHLHDLAGVLALGMAALGFSFALVVYYLRYLKPEEAKEQFPAVHAFLANKWYFDDLYSVALVRPAMVVSRAFRGFDLNWIDGLIHALAGGAVRLSRGSGRFDNGVVDYLVNVIGNTTYSLGSSLRGLQTGSLRNYVLFLALAAIGVFAVLAYFVSFATAG